MTELRLPGRHRFTPFPVGGKGVGIEVIAANAKPELGAAKATYTVRYDCCGKVAELKHEGIESRLRMGSQKCRKCAAKTMREHYWNQSLETRMAKKKKLSPAQAKEDALTMAVSGKW